MKELLLFLFFVFPFLGIAQKQNYVWKFGATGAGLDFKECSPIVLTDGINNGIPWEGQSSISDNITGQLLFYTDGVNIYDSTNQIMLNGHNVALSCSLTQTIIIKKPGSNNIFYMFTTDVQGGVAYPQQNGIKWTEIDMSLNNGSGAVTSFFNNLKDTSNCEKLTAVYHSNGQDIWLIGHEYRNKNFFSFLISNSGIDTIPVISSVGPVIYTWQNNVLGNSNFDAIGELKASPDGKKLAFTTYYNGITCLADFDNTTGIVTNPIRLILEGGGYGVSFSPDNLKLYISGVDTVKKQSQMPFDGKIFQFNISSNDSTTIQNSRTTIYHEPKGGFRSLKLGVNGKIYVARIDTTGYGEYYLGVINNPNNIGLACNYVHNGVYLNGLRCRWGLDNAIEDTTYCVFTDISEIQNKNIIAIYPNPSPGNYTLQFTAASSGIAQITIFNILGEAVYSEKMKTIAGTNKANINITGLPDGIYFLRGVVGENLYSVKIIKE
jgi:large repetitive protein